MSLCGLAFSFTVGSAQIKLESGDISSLIGVTRVNIIYDYSKMAVAEFNTEEDYLRRKEEKFNEPVKFEKFKADWFGSRQERYEPKFEDLFNKVGSKSGMQGVNYSSDYRVTLRVETQYTEPGFHAGVVKRKASINLRCTFLKDGRELVVYTMKNIPGATPSVPVGGMGGYPGATMMMSFDFDPNTRIAESYAKAGKMLAKDVSKRLKKIK